MRILVTGGAGFIGSHVVDATREAGHDVSVLDDLSTGRRENLPPAVPLHVVDLRQREAVFSTVSQLRPDAVAHLAAQASVSFSMREPLRDAEINVLGSINLLDACVAHGVPRVIFASSGGAIYGEVPEGSRASEEAPCAPKSPYAMSKLYVEQLLGVYRSEHGLESRILRYANVYGPRQDAFGEAGVVAKFFEATLTGGVIAINARREVGDEGCVRDYVHVADVARANLLALEGSLTEAVLNVGTGVGTTTRALAAQIFAAAGRETRLEYAPRRAGDLERNVLEPTRCGALLGGLTSLQSGLELTLKTR